jgi:phosphatidylglycerophosphate synthase
MDSIRPATFQIPATVRELGWAALLLFFVLLSVHEWFSPPGWFGLLAILIFATQGALILTRWPARQNFGWANRTTLLRSILVVSLVAWAPFLPAADSSALWIYGVACLIALILDGVDGKVARATNSNSEFGARFDMELDALFIFGLCVATMAIGKAGPWVLMLALMRYAFLAASHFLTWLNQPLPDSFRRKTVCVWQVVTLMIAILPPTPTGFAGTTLAMALALLGWSFALDVRWLYQRRHYHEN